MFSNECGGRSDQIGGGRIDSGGCRGYEVATLIFGLGRRRRRRTLQLPMSVMMMMPFVT